MAVTATWTPPNGATLDKSTGDIITEAIWDAVMSNLMYLGGASGEIAGSGFLMQRHPYAGARHLESGNWTASAVNATAAIVFTNAYSGAPNVVTGGSTPAGILRSYAVTGAGMTIEANGASGIAYWLADGAD